MENKQIGVLLLFLLFVILLLNVFKPAGSFGEWLKSFGFSLDINKTSSSAPLDNNNSVAVDSSSYQYQLVDTSSSQINAYSQIYYNAKLRKVYGDGRTEDIIESFRNRFSDILSEPNQKLTQYYFPPKSDTLYFRFENEYLSGVSNKYHIYRYNVLLDEMRDLYSNRYLTSYVVPSPYDQRIMLAVDDDTIATYQRLSVVNLEADSARVLITLNANETLASSVDAQGRPKTADIVWLSPNQIGYSVYRHETNSSGTNVLRFIERRVLPL